LAKRLDSVTAMGDTGRMKTALYWARVDEERIRCELCPHACVLREGQVGRCRVRGAQDGELKSLGYGVLSSAAVDPIEKKPLYHFCPGADIFSIGGWGCNLACTFCQNWTISQRFEGGDRGHTPEQVVRRAADCGSIGIAYTYNEPLVSYEFVLDCARLARDAGLANVLVTNGHLQPRPAAEMLPLIDALNIDVKSMEETFYAEHCGGHLAPVLAFAEQARGAGSHVEITHLVIPGLNDTEDGIERLTEWVAASLGKGTPLHLSAYRPQYKMDLPPTPTGLLERLHALAAPRLPYVYLGNVYTTIGSDTICPGCGTTLIARRGYRTEIPGIRDGSCSTCSRQVDIVTSPVSRG
jgi:pyruvate formate lyase activating enzyme